MYIYIYIYIYTSMHTSISSSSRWGARQPGPKATSFMLISSVNTASTAQSDLRGGSFS